MTFSEDAEERVLSKLRAGGLVPRESFELQLTTLTLDTERKYLARFAKQADDRASALRGFDRLAYRLLNAAEREDVEEVTTEHLESALKKCGITFVCAPPPEE